MAWSLVRRTATAVLRAQTLTLIGRGLRSLSSVNTKNKKEYEWMASQTTEFVEHIIKCQKNTGIVVKALTVFFNDIKFKDCSIDARLKVLTIVFNRIRNLPQADPYEVFLMKIFLKSMRTDDSAYDLTREEVSSRLLDVIQSYPKIDCDYKVTEETHFENDLGFDDFDCEIVQKALRLEFKMYIPKSHVKNLLGFEDFDFNCELVRKALYFEFELYIPKSEVYGSCKELIDYICENHKRRDSFKQFRYRNICGNIFWTQELI